MPNTASESREIARTIGSNVDSIEDNGIYAYLNGKTDHDGHSCFWIKKDNQVRVVELMLLSRGQKKELRKGEIELPVPKVKDQTQDPDFGILDYNDPMHLFKCSYPEEKIKHVAEKGNLFKLNLNEDTLNTYIKNENEKICRSQLGYEQYTCNTYMRNILSGLQKELCYDNVCDNQKFLQRLCQKASTKVHGRWFLNIAGKKVDTGIGKYVVPDNIATAIEANKKNIYLKPEEYQEKILSSIAQATKNIKASLSRDQWTENLYTQAKSEKKTMPASIFFDQIINERHHSSDTNHAQKL
ncbi:hypothetical protein [Cysteiniphilum sp. 6C5]|uniref:hypothetical protein n=1 Tax=unclassified Cysteiniphilum TaxID=2610889 RepID=UPI003F85A696